MTIPLGHRRGRCALAKEQAAFVACQRGRPRKKASSAVRFAPLHPADALGAQSGGLSGAGAVELLFPDGLTLRVAHGADLAALQRLKAALRRSMVARGEGRKKFLRRKATRRYDLNRPPNVI